MTSTAPASGAAAATATDPPSSTRCRRDLFHEQTRRGFLIGGHDRFSRRHVSLKCLQLICRLHLVQQRARALIDQRLEHGRLLLSVGDVRPEYALVSVGPSPASAM